MLALVLEWSCKLGNSLKGSQRNRCLLLNFMLLAFCRLLATILEPCKSDFLQLSCRPWKNRMPPLCIDCAWNPPRSVIDMIDHNWISRVCVPETWDHQRREPNEWTSILYSKCCSQIIIIRHRSPNRPEQTGGLSFVRDVVVLGSGRGNRAKIRKNFRYRAWIWLVKCENLEAEWSSAIYTFLSSWKMCEAPCMVISLKFMKITYFMRYRIMWSCGSAKLKVRGDVSNKFLLHCYFNLSDIHLFFKESKITGTKSGYIFFKDFLLCKYMKWKN